jgi:hypothetical protein
MSVVVRDEHMTSKSDGTDWDRLVGWDVVTVAASGMDAIPRLLQRKGCERREPCLTPNARHFLDEYGSLMLPGLYAMIKGEWLPTDPLLVSPYLEIVCGIGCAARVVTAGYNDTQNPPNKDVRLGCVATRGLRRGDFVCAYDDGGSADVIMDDDLRLRFMDDASRKLMCTKGTSTLHGISFQTVFRYTFFFDVPYQPQLTYLVIGNPLGKSPGPHIAAAEVPVRAIKPCRKAAACSQEPDPAGKEPGGKEAGGKEAGKEVGGKAAGEKDGNCAYVAFMFVTKAGKASIRLFVVATTDIQEGAELFVRYADPCSGGMRMELASHLR